MTLNEIAHLNIVKCKWNRIECGKMILHSRSTHGIITYFWSHMHIESQSQFLMKIIHLLTYTKTMLVVPKSHTIVCGPNIKTHHL